MTRICKHQVRIQCSDLGLDGVDASLVFFLTLALTSVGLVSNDLLPMVTSHTHNAFPIYTFPAFLPFVLGR